ncbi:MAG: hypothetical protein PUG60_03235 [Lachnospiraceae bacterium]|nr:hypothetical protein [Lachnospiraceae bacterium]MDY4970470.1 hypothetical protein [Lachnospiraceae bacterium]
MSEESQKADIRHIHRQMKAVCSLIQPEYRHTFHKTMKFLELQLLLQDLTREDSTRFQASSITQTESDSRSPCDLAAFVRAVAPVCNENERTFLRTLQHADQTIRMLEQARQLQNASGKMQPEDLMMQFMTPGQQKSYQEFNRIYSGQKPDNQQNQEVPHGSS